MPRQRWERPIPKLIDTGRYLIRSPWEIYRKDDDMKKLGLPKKKMMKKHPIPVKTSAKAYKPPSDKAPRESGKGRLEDRLRDKEM